MCRARAPCIDVYSIAMWENMDGRLIILIAIVIIVLILFLVFTTGGTLMDKISKYLNRMTEQSDVLSPQIRQSLQPLAFSVSRGSPSEFSYRYRVPCTEIRRIILITAPIGSRVTLGNEQLVDVLDEREDSRTFAGYLHPREDSITLEVFTQKQTRPVIHFGTSTR